MATGSTLSFNDMMSKLTFRQFLFAFGTLWDGKQRKYVPWVPWTGIEDKPGQPDVAEMLQQVQVFYTPKARKKGISEIWALYCVYVLMREPKSDAKVFGASTAQTEEFMEKRFKRQVEGLSAVYPDIPWPKWTVDKKRADCENGSFVNIYSSENTGAHGGDPRLTLFDEAQLYVANDFREMMKGILPTLNGLSQLAIIGTGLGGSPFLEAVDTNYKTYPMIRRDTWRSVERTDDDIYHKTGMIFLADSLDPRHRAPGWGEFQLSRFGGDVVSFKSQHPEELAELFLSHEGLVIASWDTARHVVEIPVVWHPHQEFYLVYDHGSTEGHPAVALFIQYDPWIDFVYVFDEVFIRGRELAFVSGEIVKTLGRWRREWVDGGPRMNAYGDVRGRYGARQIDEILLEETGISFMGVNKQDEAARLELAKLRHFRGRGVPGNKAGGVSEYAKGMKGGIAYSPRVIGAVKQISTLRYKEGKDKPRDLENDGLDCLGYGLYQIHHREPTPEPTYMQKHHVMLRKWKADVRREPVVQGEIDPLRECLRSG